MKNFLKILVIVILVVILGIALVKCDNKVNVKELQEKGYNQHQIDSILDRQSDDLWPVLLMG